MCSKDRIVQEWKLVDPPCLPRHQPLFGGFQDRRRRLLLLIAAQHTFLSWSLMALRWKTLHFHLKWWIVCLSVCRSARDFWFVLQQSDSLIYYSSSSRVLQHQHRLKDLLQKLTLQLLLLIILGNNHLLLLLLLPQELNNRDRND